MKVKKYTEKYVFKPNIMSKFCDISAVYDILEIIFFAVWAPQSLLGSSIEVQWVVLRT